MPGPFRSGRDGTVAAMVVGAVADVDALVTPVDGREIGGMQRNCDTPSSMKTATIPSVRVEPEFRAEVESVLGEGQTLSEVVEASVRASVERRRVQAEFVARGLRSRDDARRTGQHVDAEVVVGSLQRKLDGARTRMAKSRK